MRFRQPGKPEYLFRLSTFDFSQLKRNTAFALKVTSLGFVRGTFVWESPFWVAPERLANEIEQEQSDVQTRRQRMQSVQCIAEGALLG
jgi:hypothetical protein